MGQAKEAKTSKMKYTIKQTTIQDGFEKKTIFQVLDKSGEVIATCDSKADAHLEIRNLDPKLDERLAAKETRYLDKEFEPTDDEPKQSSKRSVKETTWGDGRSTNNASDIDRERYRVIKGSNYNTWRDNQEPAKGFHDPTESFYARPDSMSEEASLSDWGRDQEGLAEEQELRQALDKKLKEAEKQLSNKQAKVWELHGRLNIPFSEVAVILKISEGAAKTHYKRALANLRKYLEDNKDVQI